MKHGKNVPNAANNCKKEEQHDDMVDAVHLVASADIVARECRNWREMSIVSLLPIWVFLAVFSF